ncbi:hypothetical protein C8F04DRAFT_1194750 [Mycena alexandri]|uniref:Uncharacterized protein n=1 Tax=Mycena alexandri TaxID=1745969 RepID=A0AAD6SAZ8_9AGAR|nr:hypothetical protein C8F04DRAFT_1194750 [Mycena alexandri]
MTFPTLLLLFQFSLSSLCAPALPPACCCGGNTRACCSTPPPSQTPMHHYSPDSPHPQAAARDCPPQGRRTRGTHRRLRRSRMPPHCPLQAALAPAAVRRKRRGFAFGRGRGEARAAARTGVVDDSELETDDRLAVSLFYTESSARSAVGARASLIACREASVEEVEGEGEPEAEMARSMRAVSGVPARTTPDGSPTAASPPIAVSPPAALGVLTSIATPSPFATAPSTRDSPARSGSTNSTRCLRLRRIDGRDGEELEDTVLDTTVGSGLRRASGGGGRKWDGKQDGEWEERRGRKERGWKGGWEEDGKRERVFTLSTTLLHLPDALRSVQRAADAATLAFVIAGLVAKAKACAYKMEGPGLLYSVACVAEADIVEYRRSARDAAAKKRLCDAVNLKAGHTKNMRRRQSQYKWCDARGIQRHIWLCNYPVQRRYCVERLTHLNVLDGGAVRPIVECPSCGVHHHEFYTCPSIRGLSGFHQTITSVLASTGERTDTRVLFSPPPDAEDIYNIIISS